MFTLYCLSSVISTNQKFPQKYFLMQCLRRFCRWPPRQEYLKVEIMKVKTPHGKIWISNQMDSHVASGGGGGSFSHSKHFFLKFTYTKLNYHEVSPSPLFWNHVKYWSENKGVYNFNSEIETQAHKSSSYKILMWKFMCSNIACEHDNFWHARMLALYIS